MDTCTSCWVSTTWCCGNGTAAATSPKSCTDSELAGLPPLEAPHIQLFFFCRPVGGPDHLVGPRVRSIADRRDQVGAFEVQARARVGGDASEDDDRFDDGTAALTNLRRAHRHRTRTERGLSALRLSLGRWSAVEDVDRAADLIIAAVTELPQDP
jgi:hypothetical protein